MKLTEIRKEYIEKCFEFYITEIFAMQIARPDLLERAKHVVGREMDRLVDAGFIRNYLIEIDYDREDQGYIRDRKINDVLGEKYGTPPLKAVLHFEQGRGIGISRTEIILK